MTEFIKAKHPDCQQQNHKRFLGQIQGRFHTCCYTCGLMAERARAVRSAEEAFNRLDTPLLTHLQPHPNPRQYVLEKIAEGIASEEG